MQAKRINTNVQSGGAATQLVTELINPATPREELNFHNIWLSACQEPVDADANAQGSWVLFLRKAGQAIPIFSDAIIDSELHNNNIIALGVWCASNQTPWHLSTQIKTSRNLGPLDALDFVVHVQGITAGLSLGRQIISAHVVRK